MSALPHALERNLAIEWENPFKKLARKLKGFFSGGATRTARLYHGEFSYELVPDTAVSDFNYMPRVTSLSTGDGYVYVFEQPHYRGRYWIIQPGQSVRFGECGSLIASSRPFSLEAVRQSGRPPEWCWELSGPLYVLHFYRTCFCA
ncbi:MAG: beta/gamma crystallin family protein [Firmicutes bacterium]|nr:beta/gamma crystallin family protein [Bacillota bacterium]